MTRLEYLITKRDKMVDRLNCKDILRGTIVQRGNICGKAKCRCKRKKDPILHGPYKYLSHRSIQRTNMIFLNQKKLKYAEQGIRGYQRLIRVIYEISEINFEILRYHYNRLGDKIG